MSGSAAIAATGLSLQRLLTAAFAERSPLIDTSAAIPSPVVQVELCSTAQLAAFASQQPAIARVLLYLYRVDVDRAMRTASGALGAGEGRGHLALNLHYLLIPLGADAAAEQRILGRSLQALEATPVLSGPLLLAPAGLPADEPAWAAPEVIHLGIEELGTEALLRLFDALPIDYRLCVPYCARVVRIDTAPPP